MANNTKKFASLTTLSNFLSNLKNLFATKTDVNAELAKKANATHTHAVSDVTNLQSSLDAKVPTSRTINSKSLSSNITLSASDVGAASSSHNHDDRYYTESEIDTKLSAVNTSIDDIKSGEIVVKEAEHADSADTATSADSATTATKATQDGNGKVISSTYETKSDASAKLTEAKTYADNAANAVKNDLLNNAGTAYDTLKELGDLIDDNKDAIDALETVASGKANAVHTHAISDVSGLQSALDGKAASSHGTHVSYSTTAPVMDGTASVGTATTVARSDHKHPTDTSRASKTEFDSHNSDTTKHITSAERTKWNAAKTHADSAHAPSNAQPNQNAFSNIKVGATTIAADTTTDTLTLEGTNVTITPDATNDKVTIAVADATTSAKGVVQLTDSVTSTSTTTAATPKNVKAAYDLANTAKTIAEGKANASHSHTVANITDLTVTATEINHLDGITSNVQAQLDSKSASNHTHTDLESDIADLDERMLRKVSKSGDTMTGNLKIQKDDGLSPVFSMDASANGSGQRASLSISKNANSSVDNGTEIEDETFDGSTTSLVINRSAKYLADRVRIQERDANYSITEYALYGEHNKPTPYDLGALSISGGKVTGNITPATAMTKTIGSTALPFGNVYAKNHEVFGAADKRYGSLTAPTLGTTSTNGVCSLALGNGTASGTEHNASGRIIMYGTGNGYTKIVPSYNGNASFEVKLPENAGTLVTDKDLESLASVSTLTTAEYNELEASNSINANTLYMLTDAEETNIEVDTSLTQSGRAADAKAVGDAIAQKSQVQIITWGDDD